MAFVATFGLFSALLGCSPAARGDAGPPYLTNDPGTPGHGNWEINLASMQTVTPGLATYQVPQIDLNLGVGERLQLTGEIPYVLQMQAGQPTATGWSNAFLGAKWRFYEDARDGGWQVATFPQLETGASVAAQRKGIAVDGPRLLLPVEVARSVGSCSLNFEAGYYPQWHGAEERILGFVAGRSLTPQLELDAELYNDHAMGTAPDVVTLDVGGRYRLSGAFVLLFMVGRSLDGNGPGQVQYLGYFGIQILLSDWGRALAHER
jgi:hypothetical protein